MQYHSLLIVVTGCNRWILWFSVRYAGATAAAQTFSMLTLSVENYTSYSFTKFAGYLHWEVNFSGTEINLILKNKMASLGISLKIIYFLLLAGSLN